MVTFLIILLIIVCILLMAVVLMQSSKGQGLSGAFGGSQVTTVFGARRTGDFLSKTTIILASIFMASALLLNLYISNSDGIDESIIQQNANQNQMQPPMPTDQLPPGTQPPVDQQQQTPPSDTGQ